MANSPIELIMTKAINAPVATVFHAWTQAELIQQWFVPADIMVVKEAKIDLTVGGEYLIHMHNPEELSDHIVFGTYEEIIPNEKLVFNWAWKDGAERTQVTILLQEVNDNETLLTLTHRGFGQQEYADKHNMGWTGCLANLESLMSVAH